MEEYDNELLDKAESILDQVVALDEAQALRDLRKLVSRMEKGRRDITNLIDETGKHLVSLAGLEAVEAQRMAAEIGADMVEAAKRRRLLLN